jgi:hypothetical protein
MFIVGKKFRRKKGVVTFYYVLSNVKSGKKHKMKNLMYLGDVERIMNAVRKYNQKKEILN